MESWGYWNGSLWVMGIINVPCKSSSQMKQGRDRRVWWDGVRILQRVDELWLSAHWAAKPLTSQKINEPTYLKNFQRFQDLQISITHLPWRFLWGCSFSLRRYFGTRVWRHLWGRFRLGIRISRLLHILLDLRVEGVLIERLTAAWGATSCAAVSCAVGFLKIGQWLAQWMLELFGGDGGV